MAHFDNHSEYAANIDFEARANELAVWARKLAPAKPRAARAAVKPTRSNMLAPFVSMAVVLASMAGAGADIAWTFFG